MRKIGVCLTKGGSGKTTTAVNLAHGLARAGQRVLLIDTDTQGQCAQSLGVAPTLGLADLVLEEATLDDAIVEARPGLSLLAGGGRLAGVKREIARREMGSEHVLTEALGDLDGYDYMVVDTAPGWDTMTVNALFLVTEVLAPVNLEVLALRALGDFEKHVNAVRRYRSDLTWRYLLPTFYDRRVAKSEELRGQLRQRYSTLVCQPIRYNVRLSEAPGFGQTVFEYAPRAAVAEDYQRLTERIMQDA